MRRARPDTLWALAAMALSLLTAIVTWRLWHANLRIPIFTVQGDAAWTIETVKGIVEHGWYESNNSLGAPFGQLNYDFPANVGEFGKIAIVKVLALGIANPTAIVNLIVIGGFPLIALSAFLVLRVGLGFSRGVALVCAVLFATSPIHFVLGPVQAWLGFYLGVPLSAYLILAALGEKPMFMRRGGNGSCWSAWLSGKSVATIVLCLLVGCLGLDYAEFTCLLVGIGSILQFIARRRLALLVRAAVVIVVIATPVLVSAIPDLAYRAEHGTNQIASHRDPLESIVYGLQPVQLVLPQLEDRITPLGEFTSKIDGDLDTGRPGLPFDLGPQISLGLISAIGLLWLLWVGIGGAFGRVRKDALETQAGSALLLSILVAMGSGGSLLFAYLVTAQLRVWARIAILVGFFAVVGLGLLLERGRKALEAREHGRWLAAGLLVVVLAAGVFEGTTDRFIPDYKTLAASWQEDTRFVADVQHTVPANSMILELPYVAYPETQLPTGTTSYEPLVPYIHSTALRWSAGAMEARPEDWLGIASKWSTPRLIRGAVAAGFDGIYVLRTGYADQGAAIAGEIQQATGALPLIEPNGTALFYDLTAYAKRLRTHTSPAKLAALAHETLHPIPTV